jgi:hypothetical protein
LPGFRFVFQGRAFNARDIFNSNGACGLQYISNRFQPMKSGKDGEINSLVGDLSGYL